MVTIKAMAAAAKGSYMSLYILQQYHHQVFCSTSLQSNTNTEQLPLVHACSSVIIGNDEVPQQQLAVLPHAANSVGGFPGQG